MKAFIIVGAVLGLLHYPESLSVHQTVSLLLNAAETPVLLHKQSADSLKTGSKGQQSSDYSKHKFVVESLRLPDSYSSYEYLSIFGLPIYYENNDLNVNDFYKGNYVSLTRFYEALRKVSVVDKNPIKKIVVVGYSSPEGYTVINEDMARRRAELLRDRIARVTGVDPSKIEAVNGGEGWEALRFFIGNSTLKDRENLLNIVSYKAVLKNFNRIEDPVNAERERKLFDMKYSASYEYIKQNYFPQIRVAYLLIVYEGGR